MTRFCFFVCLATASAIGSSIAHAEIERSANPEKRSAAFERTTAVPICVARQASREKNVMNEKDPLANLNPKLGKVLARLVRMQEQFLVNESGEPFHGGKPPIGMKPRSSEDGVEQGKTADQTAEHAPVSSRV